MTPQNEGNSDAITSDPPEDAIIGDGDDESTPQDGSSNTASEEWTTILDKRIERKNKKAHKNKEKQQKKQAKQLRRQAKHGPAWAHQGGMSRIHGIHGSQSLSSINPTMHLKKEPVGYWLMQSH
jgi:hypothetical protein